MYQTDRSLPALLGAEQYTTNEAHRQDVARLRDGAWQLLACTESFRQNGSYVATERHGIPVVIRRHEDRFLAFHNVCAHRGCRLATGTGHSPELKCPYHGWQYGPDGKRERYPTPKRIFPTSSATTTNCVRIQFGDSVACCWRTSATTPTRPKTIGVSGVTRSAPRQHPNTGG